MKHADRLDPVTCRSTRHLPASGDDGKGVDVPDTGDTAWMLASSALVLLMTPGLALFYGGMVRSKSVLNMMMMSISSLGLVGVLWVLYGYSVAFGNDVGGGLLGNPAEFAGLKGLFGGTYLATEGGPPVDIPLVGTIPATVFVAFQAMFAIITVALISGAAADRLRFGPWLLFAGLWATIVYFPVAHWVFAFDGITAGADSAGGWIANQLKAIDFAGGTAVHINSGAAALAVAIVLRKSLGFGKFRKPHNVPLTLLGAGLLWAGWYAFNGGSALAAGNSAAIVMVTTFTATCAATLAWLAVEKVKDGHVTGVGAASGAVAGLVAITPACGAVTPVGSIFLGLIAGAICPLAVGLKSRFGYDDSLDVVGVHLVGGVIGTLLIGLFASATMPNKTDGLFYGGGLEQLWKQAVAAGAVMAYSFVVAFIIAFVIKKTMGIRISTDEEEKGIDAKFHRDAAYELQPA